MPGYGLFVLSLLGLPLVPNIEYTWWFKSVSAVSCCLPTSLSVGALLLHALTYVLLFLVLASYFVHRASCCICVVQRLD